MSSVVIEKSNIKGRASMPPSKSDAHRALICSFLSGGDFNLLSTGNSDDITATKAALNGFTNDSPFIDCNESGSTLRFLIPVAAALGKDITFIGQGRLPQRPVGEYLNLLPSHGVKCESSGGLPLKISGALTPGEFKIRGDVSSQYISGLLFALPILNGNSKIILTTPLKSKPYVDMTLATQRRFGIKIDETSYGYFIKGGQKYNNIEYKVEGDWSQAAFFLGMGALGGKVAVDNLNPNSIQGDKKIVETLKKAGASLHFEDGILYCEKNKLLPFSTDVDNTPDMFPALAVVAAFCDGDSVISGIRRLRLKESDRAEAVGENLKKMGIKTSCDENNFVIHGSGDLYGASLKGYNDHRIVMAFTLAGLFANGKTTIDNAESISKSYPGFFDDVIKLGGKINVVRNR